MFNKASLGAALLCVALLAPAVPAQAQNPHGGGCLITISATWSPGLRRANTSSTMSWSTSTPLCAGTDLFEGAIASTSTTSAKSMNCSSIAVIGSGSFNYDGASEADFMWAYAGGTGAGTIVIVPDGGIIVGTIEVFQTSGLVNCANDVTQASVAFTGVLTWGELA